jgi:hypothetical protein
LSKQSVELDNVVGTFGPEWEQFDAEPLISENITQARRIP